VQFSTDKEVNTMSKYLLIESKNPLDGGDYSFELAGQLREAGHDVSLYLVQDGIEVRGLTAFLLDDVASADHVLTF
jgi:hypothetical protein